MKRREALGVPLVLASSLSGWGCKTSAAKRPTEFTIQDEAQTIEGFGTCLVSWVPEIVETYQKESFGRFYLEELGASVLRVDLWNGCVEERSDWRSISYKDYRLDGPGDRGKVFVDAAKRWYPQSGKQLRVIASIWSPPAWMKINGQRNNGSDSRKSYALSDEDIRLPGRGSVGTTEDKDASKAERLKHLYQNKLRPDRYEHFAKSLLEWARFYRSQGVPLYGLGLQNEPRFSHWFSSCVYSAAELAELAQEVVSMFDQSGEELPRLYAPETMSHDSDANRLYLDALFSFPDVGRKIHALASHGYVDGYRSDQDPESSRRFEQLARPHGRAIWMSEGSTGKHEWPAPLHELAASMMSSLVEGGASLVTPWQVIEREPTEHNLGLVSGPTKKTFVAMHFFRFIRPGMRRLQVSGEGANGSRVLATRDPESRRVVLVALNRSQQKLQVNLRGLDTYRLEESYITDRSRNLDSSWRPPHPRSFALPAESIATLTLAL